MVLPINGINSKMALEPGNLVLIPMLNLTKKVIWHWNCGLDPVEHTNKLSLLHIRPHCLNLL